MINNFLSILNDLSNIKFDDEIFDNVDKLDELDLSNEDDYQTLVNTINELKSNSLFNLFGLLTDKDYDKLLEIFKNEHDKLVKEKHQNQRNCIPSVQKKVIDKSEETKLPVKTQKQEEPERPSIKIGTQTGLQIHKIVQEYVDTMIRPYNHGALTNEQINDAYAGLYEFACWLYNK